MSILTKFLRRSPRLKTSEATSPAANVRPLSMIASFSQLPLREAMATPAYAEALTYFSNYPPRSVMSDHSRAVLYTLIRTRRPLVVAEVGTMYAGTTEVMARALWENDRGIIHTTDPLGGERCPPIIEGWPQELRERTRFHALNSMDFFHHLDRQRVVLDLVLVDGNHEYEFALFDLQMAAKLLRPGGIVVMDNAEQTGPFKASRAFLDGKPAWHELGNAVAAHDPVNPFNAARASIEGTSFIVLQAPDYIPVGADMQAWGQISTNSPYFDGVTLELPAQSTAGTLHYQALLRAFLADGAIPELKTIGSMRIQMAGQPRIVRQQFPSPMAFPAGAQYTYEIDLAWEADPGSPPLAIMTAPAPL